MIFKENADENQVGFQTHWEPASSVWEIMDAAFNFATTEFMIRGYNYGPLAMLRCLHYCR